MRLSNIIHLPSDGTVSQIVSQNTAKASQLLPLVVESDTKSQIDLVHDALEKKFTPLFKSYNIEYNIAILSDITGNAFNDEENCRKIDDNEINKIFNVVKTAFDKCYDAETKQLDYTTAIRTAKQYYSIQSSGGSIDDLAESNNKPQNVDAILKQRFGKSIDISSLSYDDKLNAIKEYIVKLLEESDSDTCLNLLASITDEKLKTDCADSFNEILSNTDYKPTPFLLKVVNENMSYEGLKQYKSMTDSKYREFNEKNSVLIDEVVRKRQNHIPLDPNTREVEISEKLDKFFEQYHVLQAAIIVNKNLSEPKKQDFTNRIIETQKQYPTYQLYLESLAQFVNDNKIDLNLAEDKLEQLRNFLDEATEGKYSEVANALAEKNSAYDSEKGGFKTATQSKVAQQQQAVKDLTEKYVVAQQEPQTEFAVEGNEPPVTAAKPSAGSVLSPQSKTAALFAVVKNTVDNLTADILKEAVDTYKQSGLADQFKVLTLATGKVFSAVLKESDAGTLDAFIDGGNKCRTFNLTQQVQDKISEEEKKNDVA